jgi:hypothetical protein
MKTTIKAVSKDGTQVLIKTQDKEDWYKFINLITEEIKDVSEWRQSLWNAEVDIELTGNFISKIEIIKKGNNAPSKEKDDYWIQKFEYERDVRDVSLKEKGETDQAIEIVKLSYENKIPLDEMVKCVKEAKKLMFGEKVK